MTPLRSHGGVVVGSGNVAHNLAGMARRLPDGGYDWAKRFDEQARATMASAPADAARLNGHADFAKAAPSPDHFLPLLYLAGLAGAAGSGTDVLVDGCAFGSL